MTDNDDILVIFLDRLHRLRLTRGDKGEVEVCLKLIPRVTPLNAGELKVKEGTHGTDQMGLMGGEVGLEKRTKPDKKNEFFPPNLMCMVPCRPIVLNE